MGDWFQRFVDTADDVDGARSCRDRVRDTLLDRRIITAELTAGILGGSYELGHPPGPAMGDVVRAECAGEVAGVRTLGANGVHLELGRGQWYPTGWTTESTVIACPTCGTSLQDEQWGEAYGAWLKRAEGQLLTCPGCHVQTSVAELTWSPAWGFGEMAVTFWNWPLLSSAFIAEMRALIGPRTLFMRGKL